MAADCGFEEALLSSSFVVFALYPKIVDDKRR